MVSTRTTRRFARLSFEGGLDTSLSEYRLPASTLAELRNWQAMPDGSLKARSKWKSASATGSPPTTPCFGGLIASEGPDGHYVVQGSTLSLFYNPAALSPTGTWSQVDDVAGSTTGYVPMCQGAGFIVHGNQDYPSGRLRSWNGSVAADAGSAAVAGYALAFYKDRFWAGGRSGVGNKAFYTTPNDPTGWNTSTQFIQIGGQQQIVVFEPFLNGMLIGKPDSLYYLTGDGPNTFAVHPLDGGGANNGYSIRSTPFGAFIASAVGIFRWTGGGPVVPFSNLRFNDELFLGPKGATSSIVYHDGRVVVSTDSASTLDNLFSLDPRNGSWSAEDYIPGSSGRFSHIYPVRLGEYLVGLPHDGAGGVPASGPVVYRQLLESDYGARDQAVTETFVARTGHVAYGDIAGPATPLHLHLWLRQRNGDASDAGLEVTPIVDGVNKTTVPVAPNASPGVFRTRVDFKGESTGFRHAFKFRHALTTSDEATFDILDAVLEYDVEAPR